jgi:hypothetical protein
MFCDLASSPFVDLSFYRDSSPDLIGITDPPLLNHLQTFGIFEGRAFSPVVDLNFYRQTNLDLTGLDPCNLLTHLEFFGLAENRLFAPLIDLGYYRANNADLTGLDNAELLAHLQNNGLAEGRRPSQWFDVNYYRANHPDLIADNLTNQELYEHFLISGIEEGRASSPWFNVSEYRAANPDLQEFTNRQLLYHFVQYGVREGRAGTVLTPPDEVGNSLATARSVQISSYPVTSREALVVGDVDHYRVSLTTRSTFNLILDGMRQNADVQILDGAGNNLQGLSSEGTFPEFTSRALNPGTYYIQVKPAFGTTNTLYNLSLSLSPVVA